MTTRIVIIGGGFGGLQSAFQLKELLKSRGEITLIDRSAHHSFIPSIHLIISGKVKAEEIRIPLKTVLGASGIRFIQGEASTVDIEKREVTVGSSLLTYDYLLIATGAEENFFNIPGAAQFSYRFRSPEDAERIRAKLLELLETFSPIRIVLAGAGTEGVEAAGEVLDLVKAEERGEDLASGRITIELIEGKSRLLPGYLHEVQERAGSYLAMQGVVITTGDRIVEVRRDRVVLASKQEREAAMLIWTCGIGPSKLIRDLPLGKDPWGWLKVSDRLHSLEDDRIYGIGDAVSINTTDGPLALKRLAYHAEDQARVAALNIAASISGDEKIAYTPKTRPQLVSIGRDMGLFILEDRVSSGAWVAGLKKAVERKHLMTCLSRPVSSTLWSLVPGAALAQRLRAKLPV